MSVRIYATILEKKCSNCDWNWKENIKIIQLMISEMFSGLSYCLNLFAVRSNHVISAILPDTDNDNK